MEQTEPSKGVAYTLWQKEKADQVQQGVQEVPAKEQDLHLDTTVVLFLGQGTGKTFGVWSGEPTIYHPHQEKSIPHKGQDHCLEWHMSWRAWSDWMRNPVTPGIWFRVSSHHLFLRPWLLKASLEVPSLDQMPCQQGQYHHHIISWTNWLKRIQEVFWL